LLADVSGNFVTIRKVINHGNSRWCVSATVEGKRTQRFFRTKVDARTWMSVLTRDPTDQFWQQLDLQEYYVAEKEVQKNTMLIDLMNK
jgi:hypothetical protein